MCLPVLGHIELGHEIAVVSPFSVSSSVLQYACILYTDSQYKTELKSTTVLVSEMFVLAEKLRIEK